MSELQVVDQNTAAIEKTLIDGDLSSLTTPQRVQYYNRVCESLGLNPFTKPFAYIKLNGKLTLYALRDAAEQLRKIHEVSVEIKERSLDEDGIYTVTARATLPNGRCDESTGAVSLGNLQGEQRANGKMKAETKAKRRVTLSIVGLGWLDENEVESIPNAEYVEPFNPDNVNKTTFGNDWGAMISAAVEHLGYETVEIAKEVIKEHFGKEATVLQAWEYLRDSREEVDEQDIPF